MTREDYIFYNRYCEQALSDLKRSVSIRRWLNQYQELFITVTIQPTGLSRITSFNLGDEQFEKIKLFSNLYASLLDAFGKNDNVKISDRTIVFKIDKVALFEDRRFTNATQETYLFIEREYLKSFSDIRNHIPKFQPISVDASQKHNFIHAPEIKLLTSILDYNNILIKVLELSTNYEQVNILFPYLVDNNDFDENSISKIVNFSLNSLLVKRSLSAKRMMFELAFKNKKKMDSSLLQSILLDFPHSHDFFKIKNRGNLNR